MRTSPLVAGCSAAPQEVEEGGIEWDAEASAYVMEAEIESGEVPLQVWVEYPEYGEAVVALRRGQVGRDLERTLDLAGALVVDPFGFEQRSRTTAERERECEQGQ